VDNTKFYTFNQQNGIRGVTIEVGKIDSAMAILPFKFFKHITWSLPEYEADGIYMEECYQQNLVNHVYVDNDLCYYNKVT
jgi:hypothetical protein